MEFNEANFADEDGRLSGELVVKDVQGARVLVANLAFRFEHARHEGRHGINVWRRIERMNVANRIDRKDVFRVALVDEQVGLSDTKRQATELDLLHRLADRQFWLLSGIA